MTSEENNMDSMKQSFAQMSEYFRITMSNFQKKVIELEKTTSSTDENLVSKISSEFNEFRSFVMSILKVFEKQMDVLALQIDNMEMRSRKKMLLVHGVPESKKEDTAETLRKLFSENLNIPDFNLQSITRCNRMGRSQPEKSRSIVVKFSSVTIRDKIWFAKTGFKGTGVTVSEFLTKSRYNIFVAARQQFGTTKCWTKNGRIVVLKSDGSKHHIDSVSDLEDIKSQANIPLENPAPTLKTGSAPSLKNSRDKSGESTTRSRKGIKAK